MPSAPTLLAGRYRLGEALGAGGMGRVWLARDEVLDRDVAIKEIVIPVELLDADRHRVQERTLREARAAARLSHPGVVQVYDALQADGRTWIVMEYMPSRSLQEIVRADGPLPPSRAARIGLEVLAALNAAHRAGVWHRDVKPANVLIGDDGRVVLTDFGIAAIEGDGIVTGSGVVIGSPEYMSPERVRDGTARAESDLWSLGATLYTAVEGHSPFHRPSVIETLTALAADEPDPPRQAGALRPVLDGLLHKDPAARIDFAETERRLRKAARTPAIPRPRRPGRAEQTAAPSTAPVLPAAGRRRRGAIAVAVAAATVVAAGAIWLAVRPDADDSADRVAGPATTASATTSGGTAPTAVPGGAAPANGAASTPPSAGPATSPATSQRPPLPSGWIDHRDPTGFSVYVPEGWNRSREGTMVYFRDPRGGRTLGIDQTTKPAADPVADWRGKAAYRVERGDFLGYREIRIVSVRYWQKAADWEFTFTGRTRQHVNNRGFVVSKSQAYGLWWQTSDADWADARPDLQLVFDSFRPKR